jgi:hypothetical protein
MPAREGWDVILGRRSSVSAPAGDIVAEVEVGSVRGRDERVGRESVRVTRVLSLLLLASRRLGLMFLSFGGCVDGEGRRKRTV